MQKPVHSKPKRQHEQIFSHNRKIQRKQVNRNSFVGLVSSVCFPLQDSISIARCEACAETIASILRTCGTATFLTESMTIWRCLHITLRLISFELPADSGHISIFDLLAMPTDLHNDSCQCMAVLLLRRDVAQLATATWNSVELLRDIQIFLDCQRNLPQSSRTNILRIISM